MMPDNKSLITQENIRPPLILDDTQPIKRYQYEPEPPRRGCFSPGVVLGGCAMTCLVPMLMAMAIVGVVLFTGVSTVSGIVDGVTGIFSGGDRSASVTSSQTIVNSVKPLGQLVSISTQLAKADIRVEVQEGFQNACGRTAYHVAQGAVEAGIDLSQLSEADVSRNIFTGSLSITLPAPHLTSCRVDYMNQYSRSTSACGPAWESIRQIAQYEALVSFREDAIEGGILELAEEEAEAVLKNFLQLSTGTEVNITFLQPEAPVFPPSCVPDMPGGWYYDANQNVWSH